MDILMISPDFLPLRSGARLFSYGFAKRLSESYNLTVFAGYIKEANKKDLEDIRAEFNDINLFCVNSHINPDILIRLYIAFKFSIVSGYYYRRSAYKKIKKLIKEKNFERIVFDNCASLWYYNKIKKNFPNIKRIYNSHNAESRNIMEMAELAKGIKKLFYRMEYINCLKYEKMLLEDKNDIFTIARQDADYYEKIFGLRRTTVLNSPKIDFQKAKTRDDIRDFNYKLLFVGSMFWYPNVSGIRWFIDNVFKELLTHNPAYKLYIVGQKAEKKVMEQIVSKFPDNIIVTGSVPSVDEFYKLCDIAIIPVFEGAGAKIKVLEALAKGIPSVISTYCAKDYDLSDQALLAESPEDYISSIENLSSDMALRINLHEKGLEYYTNAMALSEDIKKVIEGSA